MAKRIGLVGMGFIGAHVYRRVTEDPGLGLEIAFVYNRSPARRAGYPAPLVLEDLADFAATEPDLIVEMAHPSISRDWGPRFLGAADYLITSVTAMAEDGIAAALERAALDHGHRLFLPHGALVGLDCLHEQRHAWESVTITFRKHPDNIDFSESGYDPARIDGETVVHDGPVRGVALAYPRNVNTMVTCALATLGLDGTRGVLVADPSLDKAIAEVEARGRDGSIVTTRKEQPAVGVSGTDMLEAMMGSVLAAAGRSPGIAFV